MADGGGTLDRAIRDMLGSASRRKPLSMRLCVDAIRMALPDCELTDAELGELIATLAISGGFPSVAFDIAATIREMEMPQPIEPEARFSSTTDLSEGEDSRH